MKKDNIYLGIVIGMFLPISIYGFLFLLDYFFGLNHTEEGKQILRNSTMQMLAICADLLIIRYYNKKLKFEQTTKGVMVAIVALGLFIVGLNFKEWVLS